MRMNNVISIATVALMVWMTAPCEATINIFLHVDGMPGESLVVGHTADSDVTDFQFGVEGGPPSPNFSLTIDKNVNVASPALALACASGTTNTSATVSCYKSGVGGALTLFYSITVSNVVVSGVSTAASNSGTAPAESVNLRFNWIQWTYVPQNNNGTFGTPIVTSYAITNH